MELNATELQAKADALKKELFEYGQNVQAEIGAMQQALQAKVREAQKIIDNKEGQIVGLEELVKELGGNPEITVLESGATADASN